jgi:hypothetical protein
MAVWQSVVYKAVELLSVDQYPGTGANDRQFPVGDQAVDLAKAEIEETRCLTAAEQ